MSSLPLPVDRLKAAKPDTYNGAREYWSADDGMAFHDTDERDLHVVAGARPFSLVRWFLWLGLGAIVVASAVTSVLFSNFLSHRMLERDAALTMEEVQAIVRIENAAVVFQTGTWDREDRNLREFFSFIESMHDVLRANIYSADGVVVWSTDKALIGRRYADNPELDEALRGELKVESGVVSREDHPKPEHVDLGRPGERFVENYIPIFESAAGRQIGVVELYRAPRALFDALERGIQLIWASGLAAGAFLFAVLFGIMKRADRTMRQQQQRLVESETLAAVGQLAGAVAHSLRNPLSSIRSSAELALDGPATDIRETSQDIISEVDRLEGMVRQLLFYSQAPTGRLDVVEIEGLLREVLGTFAKDLERRGVRARLDLEPGLPRARANAPALTQVFNSLVTNAIDAMQTGGQLDIVARPGPKRRTVVVEVKDTGRGIPRERIADLFKPFQTSKAKGLGMGLALAQRIVERAGGRLQIASTEGRGTVVSVHLRAGSGA